MRLDPVQYPGPGCIVEFLQSNQPQVGWVLEEQKGKVRILSINKREVKLQSSRLLPWSGPQHDDGASRQDILNTLNEHQKRRESLEESIDALEIWDLSQGEVTRATTQWFAELLFVEPTADELAGLGRSLLACKTHFKFQPPEFEVRSQEKVEARLKEMKETEERERLTAEGGRFFTELWAVKKGKRSTAPDPVPESSRRQLEEVLRAKIADPEDARIKALWAGLTKGLPDDQHLAVQLAEVWGIVPKHYNFWLDRAGYISGNEWSREFSEEIEQQKQRFQELKSDIEETPFICIDSSTTQDHDDGFYIEPMDSGGFRLQIVLARPCLTWEFGSGLDKAVLRRGTSLYLPEGTNHMLPEELGLDLYALRKDRESPALIVDMELDAEGDVVSCSPRITWIRPKANVTYSDAEAALDHGDAADAAAFGPQIEAAYAAAQVLRKNRARRGAFIIEREEPHIVLHPEPETGGVRVEMQEKESCPKAQMTVSEMMILVNGAMAKWAVEREIPLFFRTQDIVLPKEYSGVWSAPEEIHRVVKSLAGSLLETGPKPHAGLGLTAYSPLSSPLRRYPDLINMYQVQEYLKIGRPHWSKEELDKMSVSVNAALDAGGKIQRFRPRYWKLLFFKQQGTGVFRPAVVVDENPMGFVAALPKEQIFVRGPKDLIGDKIYPGQRIQVRLGKVDPLNNEIHILEAREE